MFFEVLLWHENLDDKSVEQTPLQTQDSCESPWKVLLQSGNFWHRWVLWNELWQLPDLKRSALPSKVLHYHTSDWLNYKVVVRRANQRKGFFTSKKYHKCLRQRKVNTVEWRTKYRNSVNNQRLLTCIYTIKVTVTGLGGPEPPPPLKTQDINLFCVNYYFCFIIGWRALY